MYITDQICKAWMQSTLWFSDIAARAVILSVWCANLALLHMYRRISEANQFIS